MMVKVMLFLLTFLFLIICIAIHAFNEALRDEGMPVNGWYRFNQISTVVFPLAAVVALILVVV